MIRRCPAQVLEWIKAYEPYIVDGQLKNAPPEAWDSFEKAKKWFEEQGQ